MSPYSLVVATYLVQRGAGFFPGGGDGPWFVYYGKEPSGERDPDNTITVYDDGPKVDPGRMRGGRWYEHPGINVRIRSGAKDTSDDAYPTGWVKGDEVLTHLAAIRNTPVVVAGDAATYRIDVYTIGQGVVFLKEEDPIKRRQLFTINGGHVTICGGL